MKRSRLSKNGMKPRKGRLTKTGWNLAKQTADEFTWEKRGIDSGLLITLDSAWLGKPEYKEGYLVELKKFKPLAGGHRQVGETLKTMKSFDIQTALNQASKLMAYADKLKAQPKKAKFVWETSDKSWRWEATKYEGNGLFFGKVTSPIVPEGEWGTWYVWEVEGHAKLVSGDKAELAEMKKKSAKAQELQKVLMG